MSLTFEKINVEYNAGGEIDTEAPAAYVCFNHNPVSRTVVLRDDDILSTLNLDRNGNCDNIDSKVSRTFICSTVPMCYVA